MSRRETARVKELRKISTIKDGNGTDGWKLEHRRASVRRLKTSEKRWNAVNKRGWL